MKKYQARTKKKKALFTRALLKTADALGYKNPEDEGVGQLIEYAKALIFLKANVNAYRTYKCTCFAECTSKDTRPPLILAINHLELVKALLLAGAQVNARTIGKKGKGTSALLEAARYGGEFGVALVQTLLDVGASIEIRDKGGATPLMRTAAMYYHSSATPESLPVITLLLAAGAKVNRQNYIGRTALMKAVRCRYHPSIAETLLNAGAKINTKDKHGRTALMLALSSAEAPIVTIKMLLAAGANPKQEDDISGSCAIDWARTEELKALLLGN